jgi:hypothetical protein
LIPAGAEEIGIGVSPGGVTVGTVHERDRIATANTTVTAIIAIATKPSLSGKIATTIAERS